MRRRNKSIVLLVVITLIISNIISYAVYNKLTMETRADFNIKRGYGYLEANQHGKAIKSLEKAIKIKESSVEARVGLAWTYADQKDYESAKKILQEAFEIDKTNAKLISDAVSILKAYDIDTTYGFLTGYMDAVPGDKVDPKILEIRASMIKKPVTPVISPSSGSYVNPLTISFDMDSQPLGTRIYYTTDGTEPSNSSTLYKEPITLESGSMAIRAVAYNVVGDKSYLTSDEYSVDASPLKDLQEEIKIAQAIYDDTEEGTAVGNCVVGSKAIFKKAIDASVKASKDKQLRADDANEECDKIMAAVKNFNNSIIQKVDKTELASAIKTAQNLLKTRKEGTEVGNQKIGSKAALQKKLNSAISVYDNILSRQADINAALSNLNSAISTFKADIVKKS